MFSNRVTHVAARVGAGAAIEPLLRKSFELARPVNGVPSVQ